MFDSKVNWKQELPAILEFIETENRPTYVKLGKKYGVSRERIRQVSKQLGFQQAILEKKWAVKQEVATEKRKYTRKKWGAKSSMDPVFYKTVREKYTRKRFRAKQAGLEFNLNFGDIVFPKFCPVLGIEIDYFANKRSENCMSWDRIDPSKGYVTGNVVIMSWRANRIKNDGSKEEHQLIVDFLNKTESEGVYSVNKTE